MSSKQTQEQPYLYLYLIMDRSKQSFEEAEEGEKEERGVSEVDFTVNYTVGEDE